MRIMSRMTGKADLQNRQICVNANFDCLLQNLGLGSVHIAEEAI